MQTAKKNHVDTFRAVMVLNMKEWSGSWSRLKGLSKCNAKCKALVKNGRSSSRRATLVANYSKAADWSNASIGKWLDPIMQPTPPSPYFKLAKLTDKAFYGNLVAPIMYD